MTIYYSRSTSGFYDTSVHSSLPPDAVEVDASTYTALMTAQAAGQTITADANGAPLAAQPTPTWADRQFGAKSALDANDGVAIRCAKAGVAYPQAWRDYDAALRAIVTASSGDPTQPLPTRPAYPTGT